MLSKAKHLSLPRQMLALLSEGGIASTSELARRLAVSEGMILVMAEDMTRRGYLARLDTACGTGCHGCAAGSVCNTQGGEAPTPRMLLTVTAKGREATTT